jgi:hypothetical protein
MGDKKQKEATMKKVKQVLVVGACILFVVLMVLSGMSSHWLTIFTVVKPGDKVIVDYTFYDAGGNPLLTTNQQIYTQTAAKGKSIIYGRQLSMVAGQNMTKTVYPVQIYTSDGGWTQQFAIFGTEYNAIGAAILGMKTGEQKRVTIPNSAMVQNWSKAQIEKKISMDLLNTGDVLTMGVSDNPEEMINSTNTTVYTRMAVITSKTADGILVDSGYPAVDISITAINPTS